MRKTDFLLKVTDISKQFEQPSRKSLVVLRRVCFTLSPGCLMGVVGGNGSGKTTLINIIAGDLTADSGTIALDGTVLSRMSPHRRARFTGRVHQESYKAMASELTAKEVLAIAARRGQALHLSFPSIDSVECELSKLSRIVGDFLRSKVDLPTRVLSGGERQLLALAIAVLGNPKLLLLDEHRASLDEEHKGIADDLLLTYLSRNACAGIAATNDLEWARSICSQTMQLKNGGLHILQTKKRIGES